MKRILVLCLLIGVGLTVSAQKLPPEVQKFVGDFGSCVAAHDYPGAMKFMDKKYLKIQWDKKGDKEGHQFMDEFLSGYGDFETKTPWINVKMSDVAKIMIHTFTKVDETEYKIVFRITLESGPVVFAQPTLIIKGKKMGFFGAVG